MLLYAVYLRNRNVFKTSLLEMEEDKTENIKQIASLINLASNTNKTQNSNSTNGNGNTIEKQAFSRIILNIQLVDKFEFSPSTNNEIKSKKDSFLINQFDFSIILKKIKLKKIKRNYFSFHQKDLVLFDINVRI